MANIQLFRCAVFILIVVMMSYSDDSCGDVKITSPVSNTVNVSVNDWLNMTFTFNTNKCSSPSYLITVEKKEQDRPMILCRIHHNKTSCFTTGHVTTNSCRCVSPSGPVDFWEKLVRPGDVEYKWRWTDVTSGKHGEKKINYHITVGDKQKDEHLQMMEFILGGVCGLLVVVIAVILISARCRKSSPSATENRKEQDTPLDSVQLTRPNPQTQAPVATGNYRQETRCNQPFIVEDEYARVVRDPRRKAPAPRQVEQQETMEMFINDLYDEKAL
ncbi:uncharacterized protein LOC112568621 isoform X2 [Pomacea canaliculata]|uniref:uncharacterized protein LOC112568621 isoform X2 n=1 Tax=Pomacea canaliculata TaxID=400727 RepID=UPI000D73174B|nr:uncharacterized protein LOC112568621 isoform X2 [Pomacea canaliculata]